MFRVNTHLDTPNLEFTSGQAFIDQTHQAFNPRNSGFKPSQVQSSSRNKNLNSQDCIPKILIKKLHSPSSSFVNVFKEDDLRKVRTKNNFARKIFLNCTKRSESKEHLSSANQSQLNTIIERVVKIHLLSKSINKDTLDSATINLANRSRMKSESRGSPIQNFFFQSKCRKTQIETTSSKDAIKLNQVSKQKISNIESIPAALISIKKSNFGFLFLKDNHPVLNSLKNQSKNQNSIIKNSPFSQNSLFLQGKRLSLYKKERFPLSSQKEREAILIESLKNSSPTKLFKKLIKFDELENITLIYQKAINDKNKMKEQLEKVENNIGNFRKQISMLTQSNKLYQKSPKTYQKCVMHCSVFRVENKVNATVDKRIQNTPMAELDAFLSRNLLTEHHNAIKHNSENDLSEILWPHDFSLQTKSLDSTFLRFPN
jgi:hypothetical protein